MEKYFEALQGLTYIEWLKLKIVIDKNFDMQKNELNKSIQLADVEELENVKKGLLFG